MDWKRNDIANELKKACDDLEEIFNMKFDSSLAVLADPCGYSNVYGIREDFLIPSACLNSTVKWTYKLEQYFER